MSPIQELPSNKQFFSLSLNLYPETLFSEMTEDFLNDDKLDVIIMITAQMVINGLLNEKEWKGVPEGTILIPGDRALFTETEVQSFSSRLVMDFTCLDEFFLRGSRTVYLVGDDEKKMRSLIKCFQEINPELLVQGAYYVNPSLSQELKLSDELIVNEINGNDPDVLVVMMDSPRQEGWIMENQSTLHAKICLGMGAVADLFVKAHKKPWGIFKTFHWEGLYRELFCRDRKEKRRRRIFYKKLEQYKNKKEL